MQFSYLGPRLQGPSSTFQQWSISPLSSNAWWQPNDVVKFMGNISDGLIDFYRSHIEFEVQVTKTDCPVGGVQVDNSAQSLINQSVLLSNQVQIQRIQQYDVLAAILSDLGFSQYVCDSRSGEGLGYTNPPMPSKPLHPHMQTGQMTFQSNQGTADQFIAQQVSQAHGFNPILCASNIGVMSSGTIRANTWGVNTNSINSGIMGSMAPTYLSGTNWATFPPNLRYNGATDFPDRFVKYLGRGPGLRAEYNYLKDALQYPQSTTSNNLGALKVRSTPVTYATLNKAGYTGIPYDVQYITNNNDFPQYNDHYAKSGDWQIKGPQKPSAVGYNKPFVGEFMRGAFQPFLSPTAPQVGMKDGVILASPVPLARKVFRMPLLSAVLGILIPPDQFQLIPAASLKNILLQLTLNPYAFFTSGYCDINQYDQSGMSVNNMQKRSWKILNLQWVWHLYTFNSNELVSSIKEKLVKGIVLSSNYYQLCAQYQLPNGSYIRNNFQIPINVESLAEINIVFLSNQYLQYTFCRKQFRLSNNVLTMQFKANGMYFPLQPITGNAGNPQTLDTTGDNWNFYQGILLSNNFLFNSNTPMPKINTKNFAINARCYNTDNTATYLPSTAYNLHPLNTGSNDTYATAINGFKDQINTDTAMGQPWFHQNRYIGKAIFSYTWEPYGHSKTMINGLDTRGYKQFDVIFNASTQNIFPKDQTMLIFAKSNVLVRYTENGIQVLGA